MKKYIFLTFLIFTSFILSASLYKSDNFHYSLNFPDNWQRVKQRTNGVFYKNDKSNSFLEVIIYEAREVSSIGETFKTVAERFKMKGSGKKTTFCKYPALRGTLSFSYKGDRYIMDLVVFKDSYYCYIIMGYAFDNIFSKQQQVLMKITNSCKLYYDNNIVYSNDGSNSNSEATKGTALTPSNTREERKKEKTPDGSYNFPITINNVRKKTFVLSEKELYKSISELNQMMIPDFYSYFNIDSNSDPDYQFTFWSKFYREVYTKNYYRVTPLVTYFKEEARKNRWSSYELAENIVRAVQEIPYERPYKIIKKESTAQILDFFTPHQTGWYNKGDCDTKSILIALILGRLGYDAILYYSAHYKHAMAGININANGTYMKVGGTKYYFIETTYPGWKIGDLPPDMKNTSKWRPVALK